MAKQTVDNKKLQDAIQVKIDRIQKDFYETYEREARNILMAIAQEGVRKIKEYVTEKFYKVAPTSENYDRLGAQGGFLATISYTIINKGSMPNQIRIYCNWDKLKRVYQHDENPRLFDAHNGFDDKKFTEGLYDYIVKGEWHSPYGNPKTTGIGEKEINDTLSELLTGRARKEVAAYMRKYFKDTTVSHRLAEKQLAVSKDAKRHKK